MSSHHIIRENQEPILFVSGNSFKWTLLDNLLEWSPILIVDEEALEKILSYSVKIDAIICLERALPEIEKTVQFQQPLELISVSEPKQKFASLIEFCERKNNKYINIIGRENLSETEWERLFEIEAVVFGDVTRSFWKKESHPFVFTEDWQHV